MAAMNIRPLLLRALKDYTNNLQFVVPRLLEYLLDFGIFFTVFIILALVMGMALRSLSYESLLRPFPEIPFSIIAVVLAGAAVGIFLFMLVTAASRGALIAMALGTYGKGSTTLQEGWEGVRKYMPRIFLYLVFLLGALVTVVVFFALMISLLRGGGGFVAPFIAFFLVAAALIGLLVGYVLTLFTPQVIAVRDAGVVDGLRGSAMFVRSNFGTVAAYGGIVFVLTFAVGIFMSVTFFIINEVTRYNPFLNLAAKIFQNILAFAVGIFISPYFEIVKTYMVIEGIGNKEEEDEGTAGER
jgi:hypothetical protein